MPFATKQHNFSMKWLTSLREGLILSLGIEPDLNRSLEAYISDTKLDRRKSIMSKASGVNREGSFGQGSPTWRFQQGNSLNEA